MIKSILAASLAAFAFTAPAAHADPPQYDCHFVEIPSAGTDTTSGVVAGYVIHAGLVSINCSIVVNGAVVDPGQTGSGAGVAVVARQITFTGTFAPGTELCATATTDHGTYDHCRELA